MSRSYIPERPDILRVVLIADRVDELRRDDPQLRREGHHARRTVAAAQVDVGLRVLGWQVQEAAS